MGSRKYPGWCRVWFSVFIHAFMFPNNIFRPTDSLILRNTTHTGPVKGLDFNPIQGNLLASGAVGGEVFQVLSI